jgi:hypothetical protein
MFQKSLLQTFHERDTINSKYHQLLVEFVNYYTIENGVFGFKNGQLIEESSGYFIPLREYKNLSEGLSSIDCSEAVQITQDRVLVGKYCKSLTEALKISEENKKSAIINISFLKEIYFD